MIFNLNQADILELTVLYEKILKFLEPPYIIPKIELVEIYLLVVIYRKMWKYIEMLNIILNREPADELLSE